MKILSRMFLIGWVGLAVSRGAFGAQTVTFQVPDRTMLPGALVSLAVMVSGFSEVTSVQFSIEWNPAVLEFQGTGDYSPALSGLAAGNFGATQVASGKLGFMWDPSDLSPTSIPNGTAIFSIKLKAVGANGTSSAVQFGNEPTPPEVSINYFTVATFSGIPGRVNVSKPVPTMTWVTPAPIVYGTPLSAAQLNATASVPGDYLYFPGAGEVLDAGNQTLLVLFTPSDSVNYDSTTASVPLTVQRANQTISFSSLPNKTFSDSPFALAATASSGLGVTFSIASGPAVSSGNTVTLTGAGTVVVRASQGGNNNYNSAADVDQSFAVAKAAQTISFGQPPNKVFGDAPFTPSATASSGLPVSFEWVSGPASVAGNVVTITGVGVVTLRVSQAGDNNYQAAAAVNQSFTVNQAAQTISFGTLSTKNFGDPPFAVSATASSGLPVIFSIASGPATISGNTVSITGMGTVTVRASQPGNENYSAATPVERSFLVGKATQTITFGALSNKTYGDAPFTLSATASSGLPVTFTVFFGPATISGNTLTITGAGDVTVLSTQGGDQNYEPATGVSQSFTVAKATQTITFATLGNKTFGDAPFSVSATSSSGLLVTFSIASGPATVSGTTVTLTGGGTVTVRASQAGNGNYLAATSVERAFTVAKASQTIAFGTLNAKTYGDTPFNLSATASSGLPVSFSIVSGPAVVNGSTVTLTGAGTVTVRAGQVGDDSYNAAASVDQPFTVAKAGQTITFGTLPGKTYGDAPFNVSATASSGLPVTFSLVSGPATLNGNTITLTGVGTVMVRASQSGDSNYNSATPVDQLFAVSKGNQTITFPQVADTTYGAAPFALSASSSSGLPITFSLVSGPATLSGNMATLTGAGSLTVRATQSGNEFFNAAVPVEQTFAVAKGTQTIDFGALSNKTYGDGPFPLSATSTAGLPVSFGIVSGPATVAGNMVTLTGAGTVTVQASQAGNENYQSATLISQSFSVAKSSQTVTFGPVGSKSYGGAPFAIVASSSSGLAVSLIIVSGPATLSGDIVTITGAGTVVVRASQNGNENYEPAVSVDKVFTVSKAGQVITFAALNGQTYGVAPLAINGSSSSGLPVAFSIVSGPATIEGAIVTVTGAGSVTIRASQAGNENYEPAAAVDQVMEVAKAPQSIVFGSLPNKVYGDAPFNLSATASSPLPVTFSVVSGPATISGNTVTITGVGQVMVRASHGGDANYQEATPVEQIFLVVKADQTITLGSIQNRTFGDPAFVVNAAASSGLPVVLAVVSGPATVTGNTLALTGAGTVTVRATQAGDDNYNPAAPVEQFFAVEKGNQSITFTPANTGVFGSAPFDLNAVASSGLPVTFNVVSGPATITGNTIAFTGAGSVTIRVSQTGNENYHAATPVERTVSVAKAPQTIDFAVLPNKTFGDPPFGVSATASSGLPVTFGLVSGTAGMVGNTITIHGTGTVTVRASQAGNDNYEPALAVDRSFTVLKARQTITFEPLPDRTLGQGPLMLNATASSGAPVTFAVVSGAADVSGNVLNLTGVGSVTVRASQPGNENYLPALDVERTLMVTGKSDQFITFVPLGPKTFGDPSFELTATSSSGLPVSFNVFSGPANIVVNRLIILGAGVVTVRASQAGNDQYHPAADVDRAFVVAKADQSTTFEPPTGLVFGDNPVPLVANASSELGVRFSIVSGPATISDNTLTLTGAGTVTVRASQSGNENYNPAPDLERALTVAKSPQTIAFEPVPAKVFGEAPFELAATASSGLPVSFSVVSGPATMAGRTVNLTGAGRVVVRATQAGDENYLEAGLDYAFEVAKGDQTVDFGLLDDKTYGDPPFSVSATASSGLPVTLSVFSGPASVAGNTVRLTGAGRVVLRAVQVGNNDYLSADRDQSFEVAKAGQTITFGSLNAKMFGEAAFAISANASSGLPVVFSIVSGPAIVDGNLVTLSGAGTVIVRASQAGDDNYLAADPVEQSLSVAKASQTISFGGLINRTYGEAPFGLTATASSGLPVTFTVVSGPATVSGNILTLTGAGTVVVRASQAGDDNYTAAEEVEQRFNVNKSRQSITFARPADKTYGDAPFSIAASASSGLPVSVTVTSGPAVLEGSTVTLTGVGAVTIRASQPGNENYLPATDVEQAFAIQKGSQAIEFAAVGPRVYGDPPFAVMANSSSGLPVALSLVSGPATFDGNMLALTGAGIVRVKASQPGNDLYLAAPEVEKSFTVSKGDQTIVFDELRPSMVDDPPLVLSATASSGLPVRFSISPGPVAISGNQLTLLGVGAVTVRASQPGNDNYNPAPTVDRILVIAKGSQTITFNSIPDQPFGQGSFDLVATASSALPVAFEIVSGPAVLSGRTLTITGTGQIVVRASQAGNENYHPAPSVEQSFQVAKQSQQITFPSIPDKVFGEAPFALNVTASSGLPVAVAVISGPATVADGNLTLIGAGPVTLRATQAGNDAFAVAPAVEVSFMVRKADQTITFGSFPPLLFPNTPLPIQVVSSSGLAVQLTVAEGQAVLSDSTLTITGAGPVVLRASQPGNENFNAAPTVDYRLGVVPALSDAKPDLTDGFKFRVRVPEGKRAVVQVSSDLKTWVNLTPTPILSGETDLHDKEAAAFALRFYRVMIE